MDEKERVAFVARRFAASGPAPGVLVGIGDDAAVLDGAGRLVWTIDEQVEGTHFRRDLAGWRAVGWRSFMAAASDLAAMGAEPWCALAALVLPDDVDDGALEELVGGQHEAAVTCGARIVGGNFARGPAVSITTTLLGRCSRAVRRDGARPGDGLWLAGPVGLAAAGLRALESGRAEDERLAAAIEAWRLPRARIADGRAMATLASAAIDVSDGLARDAGHVAEASGVALVLDADVLEGDPLLARTAEALGARPIDLALYGGEDYALLAASPAPIPGFRAVGAVRSGRGLILARSKSEEAIEPRGYDHFAAAGGLTDTRACTS
jgi:thiamine-monophosphate kinase